MKKILIVDDRVEVRELVEVTLRVKDYQILEASNAEEAIEVVKTEKPDLTLMDIMMPGEMDGLEATRLLKMDTRTQHIPVIAVTARAMDGDRETILEAGCDGYVSKPVRYRELLALVAQMLGDGKSHDR